MRPEKRSSFLLSMIIAENSQRGCPSIVCGEAGPGGLSFLSIFVPSLFFDCPPPPHSRKGRNVPTVYRLLYHMILIRNLTLLYYKRDIVKRKCEISISDIPCVSSSDMKNLETFWPVEMSRNAYTKVRVNFYKGRLRVLVA